MLADRHGWTTFIGTPKSKIEFYRCTTSQDKAWFFRRKMGEDQYQQEFECSFEAASKALSTENTRARCWRKAAFKEGEYTPWATMSASLTGAKSPRATRAASPAVDLPSTLGMSAGNQCRINKSSTAGSEEPKQSHSSSETPWPCLLRNMP
jgi:hypothetical protein